MNYECLYIPDYRSQNQIGLEIPLRRIGSSVTLANSHNLLEDQVRIPHLNIGLTRQVPSRW